ncbi:MAG TPA: ATP-binding protein [Verrucomicrobiae bacterium]|nr:ATP-binding protein [Verrucomicrobiae bacterium]
MIAFILLGGCIALHLFWARRVEAVRANALQLRNELHLLKDERAHAAAHSRLHQFAILNSMVEGALVLDSTGRIQTLNKPLETLFGLSREVRGLSLMEAFQSPELFELAERVQHAEQVRAFELTVPGQGQSRFLEVNAAAFRGFKHEPGGVIMIFHDFTRIKELENLRKEFVANVSHELRTPLTLIKGFVETLLDGAKDNPETTTRFLHTIEKHTSRLTFLIEDLLTLSQLDAGKIAMHRQLASVRQIAERVLEEIQEFAREKNMELRNQIDPALQAELDADRIQQVFYNLLENAIKYGRPGGAVTLQARALPEGAEISIADDGPGIPLEARHRIFERFFRLDRARTREAGGTGLGLAIVKHIVQAHQGQVWVESEVGVGSTFRFTLPRVPALARKDSGEHPEI